MRSAIVIDRVDMYAGVVRNLNICFRNIEKIELTD